MKYLALTLLWTICATAANWTDRKEYDLVLNIRAETSPQKRLGLLDQWKSEYPKSELGQARLELYLATYQALGDSPHTLSVAGRCWRPSRTTRLARIGSPYCCRKKSRPYPSNWLWARRPAVNCLRTRNRPAVSNRWPTARWAGFIGNGANTRRPKRSSKVLASESHRRRDIGLAGHGTRDRAAADKRVPRCGSLRALRLTRIRGTADGCGRQFGEVLERLYTSYHGNSSGLDQLRTAAAAAPFPPVGFDIESVAAAALRKQDEELSRTNPQLLAWVRMRQKLELPTATNTLRKPAQQPASQIEGVLIKPTRPASRTS